MKIRPRFRRWWLALAAPVLLHAFSSSLFSIGHAGQAFAQLTPDDPAVKAAVAKGVAFLQQQGMRAAEGHRSFAAATLLKAGVPTTDPFVKGEIDRVLQKVKRGYTDPQNIYTPAVDLILLTVAQHYEKDYNDKPDVYKDQITQVLQFVISKQNGTGDWDYFTHPSGQGDTSQTQFALLALWSATEEGFDVPVEVWEKAADWMLKTQFDDGGFSYHPRGNASGADHGVEHGMTVAGVTSLAIAGMHLYSSDALIQSSGKSDKDAEKEEEPKQSPLEVVPTDRVDEGPKKHEEPGRKTIQGAGKSNIPLASFRDAIGRGVGWLATKYAMEKVERFDLYYRYGIERMTALLNQTELGGHDWYDDGAQFFLKEQESDGSWGRTTYDGKNAGTCFAILFLTRATWRIIDHPPGPPGLAGGLQVGKRGGIDVSNLGNLTTDENGEVVKKKFSGPLDDLLSDLYKNPQSQQAELLAPTLIDEFISGKRSRDELIGQKDNIKLLLDSKNTEVRRAALWALGRCEDLSLAPLLIKALGERNLDVVIDARNSLCILSRKPLGDGLAAHPWDDLPEDASDEAKRVAFEKWQSAVIERWNTWYERVRPYDQRDDLSELGTR